MSVTELQPFHEELLKHVQSYHYSRAKSFGEKVAKNRNQNRKCSEEIERPEEG